MERKRVWDSDTASEEDIPVPKTSGTQNVRHIDLEGSDTGSDEDLSLPTKQRFSTSHSKLKKRKVFSEKTTEADNSSHPPRKKIVSRIVGKNFKDKAPKRKPSTPPVSPPRETVKPSPPKPIERVFHHSGVKKYTVQDGPVTLIPYENSHARGNYSVRVIQDGGFVGLIVDGEETSCRKLIVFHHYDCINK
jgi:hypothetical protein